MRELEHRIKQDYVFQAIIQLNQVPDYSTFSLRAKVLEKHIYYGIYAMLVELINPETRLCAIDGTALRSSKYDSEAKCGKGTRLGYYKGYKLHCITTVTELMVDIDTHQVIDMIFSRELNDVVEWLKTYQNLKIVSRDGSITYKNAISLSHPKAIQISDRFHLLKNLTTYCKEYLNKIFKSKIVIEKNIFDKFNKNKFCADKNKEMTRNERALKSLNMINSGFTKTAICQSLKMNIRTLNKIINLKQNDINCYGKNKLTLKQQQRFKNKQELINTVREMKNNYSSVSKIASELNLDRRTINKYLDPTTTGINGNLGSKRTSNLDPYLLFIDHMVYLGATSTQILEKIKNKGYAG
ncbi:hypothetical protein B0H71_003468 [Clostridium saccharobutylicum]|nr:hypothetical protein [Clostridium saccharobutylicum]NOV85637.1 hypothetical protein [Clostridium saccharobutylicum]NSB53609.1 hypothetical protein [Clostridium saccharobutylicum]